MKSAAVFLILSLAVVAVMSMPQESPESKEAQAFLEYQAFLKYPDPCQLKPVVEAKCGEFADFGKCIYCIFENCYAQAFMYKKTCDAHKQCINNANCS